MDKKDKKKHSKPDHITEFMSQHLPQLEKHPHRPYVEQIIRTALRISEQDMELLDLKIMNSALRELRYAFQVFEPYRSIKKVSLFGSARTPSSSPYYQSAAKFSSLMVKEGWMIITGAASGIMQAGNEGAGSKKSFGVNIMLPFEQSANRSDTPPVAAPRQGKAACLIRVAGSCILIYGVSWGCKFSQLAVVHGYSGA